VSTQPVWKERIVILPDTNSWQQNDISFFDGLTLEADEEPDLAGQNAIITIKGNVNKTINVSLSDIDMNGNQKTGGIFTEHAFLSTTNCSIDKGTTSDGEDSGRTGGGIFLGTGTEAHLNNMTIVDCQGKGAGLLSMDNASCILSGKLSYSYYSRAIWLKNRSYLTFTGELVNCTNAGGVSIDIDSSMEMKGNIKDCGVNGSGGAVDNDGTFELTGDIQGCYSTVTSHNPSQQDHSGGAIRTRPHGKTTMTGNIIKCNSSYLGGGRYL